MDRGGSEEMVHAHCSLKGERRGGLWRVGGKWKMAADLWGCGVEWGSSPALVLLSPEGLDVKKTPTGVSSRVYC